MQIQGKELLEILASSNILALISTPAVPSGHGSLLLLLSAGSLKLKLLINNEIVRQLNLR